MSEFWRSWYLMFCLRRKVLKESEKEKHLINFGSGDRYYTPKQKFLEQISEKRFFLFQRSNKDRNKRLIKDNAILEKLTAQQPQKVDEKRADALGIDGEVVPANSLWIRTTGAGDEFTHLTTALSEFFSKYKILWAVLVALVLFCASWSPTARDFLKDHFGARVESLAPLISQQAINNSSSTITQIANVNQEATYTWSNVDSWTNTIKTCSEQHLTADCVYTVELQFVASTPLPPLGLCLNIKSDADIAGFSLSPYGEAVHVPLSTHLKNYSFCMPHGGSLVGTGPTFKLELYQKPNTITASLIKNKN